MNYAVKSTRKKIIGKNTIPIPPHSMSLHYIGEQADQCSPAVHLSLLFYN